MKTISEKEYGEACAQLEWAERYFSKQWMDEDYPLDKVWEVLTRLYNECTDE